MTPTPTPTPTLPPNSYQLLDAAVARGEITRDQAATYKVYALFGARSEIPTPYISTEPVPGDGTMLFLEAVKEWAQLSPATQALINDFITPKEFTPTMPSAMPAARSTQSVAATRTPTLAPTRATPTALRNTIVITPSETGAPSFAVLSSNLPPTSTLTYAPVRLKWTGAPLPQTKTLAPAQPTAVLKAGALANNWETLVEDNFENAFPPPTCVVTDATRAGGFERYWGQDSLRASSGTQSMWPARAGANGLNPATNNYANTMDSWFVCGPYDFTNAQNLQTRFRRWVEDIPGNGSDFVGFVYSTTGNLWDGVLWWGVQPQWVEETFLISQYAGQPQVWVAFVFRSNGDGVTGKGVWIDDLSITRTALPAASVDLAVQMTASATRGNVGQPLTYTISATNKGTVAANGTTLNFQSSTAVFTDTRFARVTSSQGACTKTDNATTACALNTLNANSVVTVTVVITPTVQTPATITNTVQITSTVPPPELNATDNQVTQTTAIALPQLAYFIHRCGLTEYYDTPEGNFRIHYARSYPNIPWPLRDQWHEEDCSIKEPNSLDTNGYPLAIVKLGESLEASNRKYAAMGYSVDRTYREPASGRNPIYLGSEPVWICPDGLPSYWFCWNNGSVSLRSGITFSRNLTAAPRFNPGWPIDAQRVSAAHEYFHTVQYTYLPASCELGGIPLCFDEFWWQEATADWAEHKVYENAGWYPGRLDKLLGSPDSMVTAFDNKKYGSFILATFLEQKVANSDVVIRRTWEERTTQSNMLTAIDRTLRDYYSTNLEAEFPKFTWYNYFLNSNTYTPTVTVYIDWRNVTGNPSSQPEWQLFRRWLDQSRQDFDNNAGVLAEQVLFDPTRLSKSGPSQIPNTIDPLGAAYIEFFQQGLIIPIGGHVDLNFTVTIPGGASIPSTDRPQVSVLPVAGDFNVDVHPPNNFINPVADPNTRNLTYAWASSSFANYRRVAVIISNPSRNVGRITFNYSSSIVIH